MKKLSMILFAFVTACGGDSAPANDAAVDGATADEVPSGDGNDSFDEAEQIPPTGTAASGTIDKPGDHDFYKFTGSGGDWVIIFTDANPEDNPTRVDTVIKIYDSTMTMIAENDDGVPRINTDSEVIMRIPADGTYYVELLEYGEWISDDTVFPKGNSTFDYDLFAIVIDAEAIDSVVEDPETGDDAASATPLEFSDTARSLVYGRLDDATDIDVFSFTAGVANTTFYADVMPAGVNGYGSTSPAGRVWITDATGATIIARIDHSADFTELQPPLTAGVSYLLWVEFPVGGTAGQNDFYVIKHNWGGDNPAEPVGVNDTAATANPLDMQPNGNFRSGFILASLTPATTDVDYFSYDVQAGEVVTVACGSASLGSGLQGVRAEVRSMTDTVVAMQTEGSLPDTRGILIENAAAPLGTGYLRLTAISQNSQVTSNFIRCGVHLGAP